MKSTHKKSGPPSRRPERQSAPGLNEQLPAQTRKQLGRHYAAKYRSR